MANRVPHRPSVGSKIGVRWVELGSDDDEGDNDDADPDDDDDDDDGGGDDDGDEDEDDDTNAAKTTATTTPTMTRTTTRMPRRTTLPTTTSRRTTTTTPTPTTTTRTTRSTDRRPAPTPSYSPFLCRRAAVRHKPLNPAMPRRAMVVAKHSFSYPRARLCRRPSPKILQAGGVYTFFGHFLRNVCCFFGVCQARKHCNLQRQTTP